MWLLIRKEQYNIYRNVLEAYIPWYEHYYLQPDEEVASSEVEDVIKIYKSSGSTEPEYALLVSGAFA